MTQSIAYQFWLKLLESYILRSILGRLVSCFHDHIIAEIRLGLTVRDKCLYLEFFWSVFSRKRYSISLLIQSEGGKILTRKTPNTDFFYIVPYRFWGKRFPKRTYDIPVECLFFGIATIPYSGNEYFIYLFIFYLFNVGNKNIQLKVYRKNSFFIKRKC